MKARRPARAVRADDRPFDETPVDTADLPATPTRDRNITATAWIQAPPQLIALGEPLGVAPARTVYKRRIGDWLLWRAGPAQGPARYLAICSTDPSVLYWFALDVAGVTGGIGPSGVRHERFRAWKEDLLGR